MTHRGTLVAALAGCLLAGGAPAAAQTVGATTGTLNGKVTDRTGALLPGVVVVTSGNAMMRTRTTVTDARGWYEVPLVPPGRYGVEFSLPGFKTERHEGVHVNLGGTTTVDVVLDLAAGDETVDVTYSAGQALVDSGQGHVHLAHNTSAGDTEMWVTYFDVPAGGSPRIDVPAASPACAS